MRTFVKRGEESLVSQYQFAISRIDALAEQVVSLKESVSLVTKIMGELSTFISNDSDKICEIKEKLQEFGKLNDSKNSSFSTGLISLSIAQQDANNSIIALTKNINSCVEKFKEISELRFDLHNLDVSHAQQDVDVNNKIEMLVNNRDFVLDRYTETYKKLEDNTKDITEIEKILGKHVDDVNSLTGEVDRKFFVMKNDLKYRNEVVDKNFDSMRQYFTKEISAIVIPDVSKFVTADELKKSALSFEKATLDSGNANLRSSNNEHKILILEKKVEQLQLMLNKIQIQG